MDDHRSVNVLDRRCCTRSVNKIVEKVEDDFTQIFEKLINNLGREESTNFFLSK